MCPFCSIYHRRSFTLGYNQDHQQRIRDHHRMNKLFRNSHHEHDLVVIQPDCQNRLLMTIPQRNSWISNSFGKLGRFRYHFPHPDFRGLFRRWFLFGKSNFTWHFNFMSGKLANRPRVIDDLGSLCLRFWVAMRNQDNDFTLIDTISCKKAWTTVSHFSFGFMFGECGLIFSCSHNHRY